jgi:hypothetical protein
MSVKHTGNSQFHSAAPSIGTTRWKFELAPAITRGYVIDLQEMSLPNRWYAFALVENGEAPAIKVFPYGNDDHASLDESDLNLLLTAQPVLDLPVTSEDAAESIERFERSVSFVMHGMLAPVPEVGFIWSRLATTDGTDAFAPA